MNNTEAPLQKSGKIKGKVRHKQINKQRAQLYLTRATCMACRLVFRSPKKRLAHVESGHKSQIGVNKNRAAKSALIGI